MLYVLYGSDTKEARSKVQRLLVALQSKRPEASVFRIESDTFSEEKLTELIQSQGLFEQKYIVVLDMLFEKKDARECIVEKVPAIAQSENIFILLEATLDAKTITKLEKQATKVQQCGAEKVPKEPPAFNIFTLSDALAQKDKKALWVLYQKAKQHNVADEEIHGMLFWQLKTLLVVSQANGAAEAGLKPFVYTKARNALRNYTLEELKEKTSQLVRLYHDSRRGIHELDSALERWILSI